VLIIEGKAEDLREFVRFAQVFGVMRGGLGVECVEIFERNRILQRFRYLNIQRRKSRRTSFKNEWLKLDGT
jgi:hypothetical protein